MPDLFLSFQSITMATNILLHLSCSDFREIVDSPQLGTWDPSLDLASCGLRNQSNARGWVLIM